KGGLTRIPGMNGGILGTPKFGIILHKILYSVKGCTVPFALWPYLITRGTPGPLELFRDSSTCGIFVASHSGIAKLAVGGFEMILCRLSSGSHSATLLGSTFKLVVVVEMLESLTIY